MWRSGVDSAQGAPPPPSAAGDRRDTLHQLTARVPKLNRRPLDYQKISTETPLHILVVLELVAVVLRCTLIMIDFQALMMGLMMNLQVWYCNSIMRQHILTMLGPVGIVLKCATMKRFSGFDDGAGY
ncbi:hypothetical protein EVAR_78309_1 [Eumeta japonica]|uniref:Uncharacterized protein n=1 Tax=Eumeta variegata TaxID=151549 RepID=A0A4C1T468_EUMVA|nr:hypothetical protein EVAR_78309_1 [Eumeta japonica]